MRASGRREEDEEARNQSSKVQPYFSNPDLSDQVSETLLNNTQLAKSLENHVALWPQRRTVVMRGSRTRVVEVYRPCIVPIV